MLGVAAAWLVLVRQAHYGPGLTPDSASYLILALRLLVGDTLGELSSGGGFPPLFPAAVALGSFFGDPMRMAAWINAAAFGCLVIVMVVWARQRQVPPWLAAWLGAAVALCAPLTEVAGYLWSEALFLLLATLALAIADRFLVRGGGRLLLLSASCAALCCLTRHLGIAVVMACVSALLLAGEGSMWARSRRALVYSLALVPSVFWLTASWLNTGDPLGKLHAVAGYSTLATADAGVTRLLYAIVGPWCFDDALGEAVAPPTALGVARKAGGLLAIVGVGAVALLCLRRLGVWRALAVPGCFAIGYAFFLWSGLWYRELLPELRFFAPLHVPVLLIAALSLAAFVAPGSNLTKRLGRWRKPVVAGVGVALGLWLVPWAEASRDRVAEWRAAGSEGYGSRRWAYSETLAHIRATIRPGYYMFGNDPFAVCLLVEYRYRGSCHVHFVTGQLKVPKKLSGRYLVWLHRSRNRVEATLAEWLAADERLRVVAVLADGVLLRHDPKAPAGVDLIAQVVEDYLAHAEHPVTADEGAVPATDEAPRLYLDANGKRLTYRVDDCDVATVGSRVFLHVGRVEPVSLPGWLPFDNLDFDLRYRALPHDGGCVATAQLPDYAIAWVRTGASGDWGDWEVRFNPGDVVAGRATGSLSSVRLAPQEAN